MSSITELIRKEIESLSTDPTKTSVGTITALADGVAKVEGAFQSNVQRDG